MVELLEGVPASARPTMVNPAAGDEFEFGTERYRASVYARAILQRVPSGVPIVVSDDPAAWKACGWLATRNPFIGVHHSDDDQYDLLVRRHGPQLAALVCVSRRIQERALALGAELTAPVVTIPCGVPLAPVSLDEGLEEAGRLRIIWVGRMDEHQKRASDLPKIADRLRALGIAFRMELIGNGPELTRVEQAIRQLELGEQVRCTGWLPSSEVLRRMRQADVLLLPSNFEGMPVVVMEALSSGCAIVASRVSGIEDYEDHALAETCFWTHAVGDVDGAAECVARATRVERSDRRRRARALAEREFSISVCADRYATALGQLAPRVSPSRAGQSPRPALVGLVSHPIAASRLIRLWARGRLRREPQLSIA